MIERDVAGMRDIALSLTVPDTGVMVRKKGDYSSRQGVCGAPLTETDLTKKHTSVPFQNSSLFLGF